MADTRPLGPAQVGVGRALPVKVINRKTKKKDFRDSGRINHLNKVVRDDFVSGLRKGTIRNIGELLRKSGTHPGLAVAGEAAVRLREEHEKIEDQRRKARLLKGSEKK